MTPEQRASHAKELLNNPLLVELIRAVQTECMVRIAYAEPNAHDARQMHAAEWRALETLLSTIQSEASRLTERPVKSVA